MPYQWNGGPSVRMERYPPKAERSAAVGTGAPDAAPAVTESTEVMASGAAVMELDDEDDEDGAAVEVLDAVVVAASQHHVEVD